MKFIKQPFSLVLAAVLAVCLFSLGVSALVGDVNGDGGVDMKDVLTLRKYIANIGSVADEASADVNQDTSIDMKDVLRLRRQIAHIEPDDAAAAVIGIVNAERAAAGLSPLAYNAKLQQAADARVREIGESFSHTRPDGTSWVTVLDEYRIAQSSNAESIASGYTSAESLMDSLLQSSGHRSNFLNENYTDIAVGYDAGNNAWAVLFIKAAPFFDPAEVNVPETIARVVELVNKERAAAGVAPLSYNASLQPAADVRVKEIVELFSHTRPDGTACFTAIKEIGIRYSYAGENIAVGQRSAEEVMEAWMNSEGHRKNILDSNFTQIAVGYDPATHSWVQLFMTPA